MFLEQNLQDGEGDLSFCEDGALRSWEQRTWGGREVLGARAQGAQRSGAGWALGGTRGLACWRSGEWAGAGWGQACLRIRAWGLGRGWGVLFSSREGAGGGEGSAVGLFCVERGVRAEEGACEPPAVEGAQACGGGSMCGPLQGLQAHRPPWGEAASPGPRAQRKRVRVWKRGQQGASVAFPGPSPGSGAAAPPRAGSSLAPPPARSASRSAPPATAWLAAGPGTRGDPWAAAPPASRPQTRPPTARSYQPRASGRTAAAPRTAARAEGGLWRRPGRRRRAERGCACGLRPWRGAGRRGGSSPGREGGDRGGPSQAQPPSAQHPPTRRPVLHPLRTPTLTGPPIPVSPTVFSTSHPPLHRIRPHPNFAHSVPSPPHPPA